MRTGLKRAISGPILALAMTCLAPNTASATVLTFDNISVASIGTIPNGYGGLNWTSMGFINGSVMFANSGYENGAVSGQYVAFNEFAAVGTAGGPLFNFNSAYLTGAWNNGLTIRVRGFLGANPIYTQSVVVNAGGPTFFAFNYLGIDRVEFLSAGGVNAGLGQFGEHFAMDNLDFTAVPEPASLLLLGSGLVGAAVRRLRRRQ